MRHILAAIMIMAMTSSTCIAGQPYVDPLDGKTKSLPDTGKFKSVTMENARISVLEYKAVTDYSPQAATLLEWAPLRTNTRMVQGSSQHLVFNGGGGGTFIDYNGTVHPAPEDAPRFFGTRYESGLHYDTDTNGDKLLGARSETFPNGILFLGDSQTANGTFDDILKRKFGCSIRNGGIGGYTLSQIDAVVESNLRNYLSNGGDVAVIQGGINDLITAGSDISDTLMETLKSISGKIVAYGVRPVFINVGPWDGHTSHNATRQTATDNYNTKLNSFCSENGYLLIDVYSLFEDPADADNLLDYYENESTEDELHWNDAASEAIAEILYHNLKKSYMRGLLIEGAVQNIALYSEDASNAAWVKSNTARSEETATAPDGAATVDKITATAADGTMLQTVTASSGDFTFSVWLKRDTGTGWVSITADGGTTYERVYIGDYWARYDITATTTNPSFGIKLSTDTDAVLFWGAQLESGEYPKSYVPTTSASATKAAETLLYRKISGTGDMNDQSGTMMIEWQSEWLHGERNTTNDLGVATTTTGAYSFRIQYLSNNLIYYKYGDDDNHFVNMGSMSKLDRDSSYRVAFQWGSGGLSYTYMTDDTSYSITSAFEGDTETNYDTISQDIYVGSMDSGNQLNAFIRGFWIYSDVLTEEEVEDAYFLLW